MEDPKAIDIYIKYMYNKKNLVLNRDDFPRNGYKIDTKDMFNKMHIYSSKVHTEMLHCLSMLRKLGFITVALTNNFSLMPKDESNKLLKYFDAIIESAVIRLRKPNPKMFEYALNIINKTIIDKKESENYEIISFIPRKFI